MQASSEGVIRLSQKSWWHHAVDVLRAPSVLLTTFLAVLGVLWLLEETAIQFLGHDPRGWGWVCALAIVSAAVAVGLRVHQYLKSVPEGLDSVSRRAQRIAHLQRPKWECRLAQQLLAERLGPLESQLRALLEGEEFVAAKYSVTGREYFAWLRSRGENVLRMLEVANQLVIRQFPTVFYESGGDLAVRILRRVEAIERFYEATIEFERDSYTHFPPEHFERAHKLQQGWSEPVRALVTSLFAFLQQVREADDGDRVEFDVVVGIPDGIEEFGAELDRVSDSAEILVEEGWY